MRLYVECGNTFVHSGMNTGIQRVVRSIVKELNSMGHGVELVPVAFVQGRFITTALRVNGLPVFSGSVESSEILGRSILRWFSGRLRSFVPVAWHAWLNNQLKSRIARARVRAGNRDNILDALDDAGDPSVLLLLDSTWAGEIWPYLDHYRKHGGRVVAVLYDMIPFLYPDTVDEGTRIAHTSWWGQAHYHIDCVACISQSVRQDYLKWLTQQEISVPLMSGQVAYFRLGSELSRDDPMIRLMSEETPFFLMVGSLEPRKNYGVVLDAFEILWRSGNMARLVIVGAHGWRSEPLLARMLGHPEFNQRLFLIRDASDRDLASLYVKTEALISSSLAEGFGLPVAEAIQYGAPIICSDIPIFHEVAGGHGHYFVPTDRESLVVELRSLLEVRQARSVAPRSGESLVTWRDSAGQLLEIVRQCMHDAGH